jgi:hypothetical protein
MQTYSRIETDREKAYAQQIDLNKKISKLAKVAVIQPGPKPEQPSVDDITAEEIKALEIQYKAATDHNAQVRFENSVWANNMRKASEFEVKTIDYKFEVDSLQKLEEALGQLDEAVLRKLEAHCGMRNGYKLTISSDDISVVDFSGKPYTAMSTGERIRADAYISEKIANSLPKKVKTVFIDNAELVSGELSIDIEQVFHTYVDEGDFIVANAGQDMYLVETSDIESKLIDETKQEGELF